MSDNRLRELERKWKETKQTEDEATYLKEALRTGQITQQRLWIAMHCGHAAAAMALEIPTTAFVASPNSTRGWIAELLETGGTEAALRAGLAAGRLALQGLRPQDPAYLALTEIIIGSEQIMLTQDQALAQMITEQAGTLDLGVAAEMGFRWSITAIGQSMGIALLSGEDPLTQKDDLCRHLEISIKGTADILGYELMFRLVCQEVLVWALGRGDPLRENPTQVL